MKPTPSLADIRHLCRFFALGKVGNYKVEKKTLFPHANPLIFITTAKGKYALKFYPLNFGPTIAQEYAINHILIAGGFATPLMHAGPKAKPFLMSHEKLVTCYSYVDGIPAWKRIEDKDLIHQMNAALLSLKQILKAVDLSLLNAERPNLPLCVHALLRSSRALGPYDQKDIIESSLLRACQTFKQHRLLFTQEWLHQQPSLANFLICKKILYTIDLEHVQEDYILSDLAGLVISCLSFELPIKTVKTITNDYFNQHKIKKEYIVVLNTLVQLGLIEIYLKNIDRKPSGQHTFDLSSRKKSIPILLKKLRKL